MRTNPTHGKVYVWQGGFSDAPVSSTNNIETHEPTETFFYQTALNSIALIIDVYWCKIKFRRCGAQFFRKDRLSSNSERLYRLHGQIVRLYPLYRQINVITYASSSRPSQQSIIKCEVAPQIRFCFAIHAQENVKIQTLQHE